MIFTYMAYCLSGVWIIAKAKWSLYIKRIIVQYIGSFFFVGPLASKLWYQMILLMNNFVAVWIWIRYYKIKRSYVEDAIKEELNLLYGYKWFAQWCKADYWGVPKGCIQSRKSGAGAAQLAVGVSYRTGRSKGRGALLIRYGGYQKTGKGIDCWVW